MAWDWIIRIIVIAVISWITIKGYNSGLRGLWLIGYVVLCMAVIYGVIALIVTVGAIWTVIMAIGLAIAIVI